MASLSPEMGGTYTLGADGMYYPDLELPEEKAPRYGKYGRMRHTYLREHKKAYYTTLLFDGKLVAHLKEIDNATNSRTELIIEKMCPTRIAKYIRQSRTSMGHSQTVAYITSFKV